MKRLIITIFLAAIFAGAASAQVTIGSTAAPDKAKLLQIENSGGLGLPRVALVDINTLEPFIDGAPSADDKKAHTGLMVYNLSTTSPFKKTIYVWDGEKWIESAEGSNAGQRWFYMPAFNLPMEQIGTTTFNLYAEYQKQFTQSLNTAQYKTSNSSLTTVPAPEIGTLYTPTQLDYVVVNYDETVISVSKIDANGVMTYEVKDIDPSSTSFMTIVFVVKE